MRSRIFYLIKKEFLQLFRDPRMFWVAIMAPIVQLIVFGYIATTDIKHVSTAVFDADKTYYSRSYLESFKNSGYFDLNYYADNENEITRLIDSGRAKLALRIPCGFGRKLIRGEQASVQAIIDGTNSSAATIVSGYIDQINFQNTGVILRERRVSPLDLKMRIWYNPEMKSVYFMVPAIFALILMIESMILTAFSIVKEKERGTLEQLIVTPLRPYELILGKLLPFVIVSFLDVALVYLVAVYWFRVPMHGNVILLFVLGAVFLATGLGLGVFISTISHTLRQAMMSAIFVLIPSMILSGFIFPIANMPKFIQGITYFIPVRYFMVIVRGIFLKGIGIRYLLKEVWPLILFGSIILSLSVMRFRKKIE
jgi:ABC-2 type transport system permease protein